MERSYASPKSRSAITDNSRKTLGLYPSRDFPSRLHRVCLVPNRPRVLRESAANRWKIGQENSQRQTHVRLPEDYRELASGSGERLLRRLFANCLEIGREFIFSRRVLGVPAPTIYLHSIRKGGNIVSRRLWLPLARTYAGRIRAKSDTQASPRWWRLVCVVTCVVNLPGFAGGRSYPGELPGTLCRRSQHSTEMAERRNAAETAFLEQGKQWIVIGRSRPFPTVNRRVVRLAFNLTFAR